MATLKIKFRPSVSQGKEGKIFYRITHNRQSCQITTDYRLFANEWDGIRSKVIIPESCSERFRHVSQTAFHITSDIERLHNIIRQFKRADLPYSSYGVVETFISTQKEQTDIRRNRHPTFFRFLMTNVLTHGNATRQRHNILTRI